MHLFDVETFIDICGFIGISDRIETSTYGSRNPSANNKQRKFEDCRIGW